MNSACDKGLVFIIVSLISNFTGDSVFYLTAKVWGHGGGGRGPQAMIVLSPSFPGSIRKVFSPLPFPGLSTF